MKRTWALRILPLAWAVIGADGGRCDLRAGWDEPMSEAPPSEPSGNNDPPQVPELPDMPLTDR